MGLILDSSVVIDAERRGDTVERLIERVVNAAGDQEAALSDWSDGTRPRSLSRQHSRSPSPSSVLSRRVAGRPYRIPLHKRDRDSGWQTRWRATESRCGHPLRRFADRCDSTFAGVLRADRQHAPLPADAWSFRRAVPITTEHCFCLASGMMNSPVVQSRLLVTADLHRRPKYDLVGTRRGRCTGLFVEWGGWRWGWL
jgi:hypothetical protein